nr:tetratricopeptide repeat protein 4 isoform X1 [Leptinotarsa decemlineata]
MDKSEDSVKKVITDEERLQLAAKLDKELDEFIEKLPRKKYEDGWPEDRWEEEMEKHPFFMKEPPKPGQELHPLYEGLQQLKYDPEENEPEELAVSYKEDGNFNFKHKNYRLAVLAYTEGIKIKCGNQEIEASLLNNRAAAHVFLKNYRSSLRDCELALKVKPHYGKALVRAANCCFEMRQYKKALEFCDEILDENNNNTAILDLRSKCINNMKVQERDDRKKKSNLKKKIQGEKVLIEEIITRGYNVENGVDGNSQNINLCLSKIDSNHWMGKHFGNLSIDKLEPHFPELVNNRVFLNESNNLVWPIVFVYPEYKIMDYVQQFNEEQIFSEQLYYVFENFPEWDHERKYKPDHLNVYYETSKKKIVKVDIQKTLKDILKSDGFLIKGGTPSFIIFVKESQIEKQFLKEYL